MGREKKGKECKSKREHQGMKTPKAEVERTEDWKKEGERGKF